MGWREMSRVILGVMACAVCCLASVPVWSKSYDVDREAPFYGYLNQHTVPELGSFACGPTAAANALVYLQNKYRSIYGDSLVPWQAKDLDGNNMLNSLDNAIAVVQKLSEDRFVMTRTMHTTNHQFLATGIRNYIESVAPGKTTYSAMDSEAWGYPARPAPDWVNYNTPSWKYLYDELVKGSAVVISMRGHIATATYFHWDDANDDGVMDRSEKAIIGIVDPGTGMLGQFNIWHGGSPSNRTLEISYGEGTWIRMIFSARPKAPKP